MTPHINAPGRASIHAISLLKRVGFGKRCTKRAVYNAETRMIEVIQRFRWWLETRLECPLWVNSGHSGPVSQTAALRHYRTTPPARPNVRSSRMELHSGLGDLARITERLRPQLHCDAGKEWSKADCRKMHSPVPPASIGKTSMPAIRRWISRSQGPLL